MTGFILRGAGLAAVALVASTGASSAAQMVCGERNAIVDRLENKYGETRRSFGLQQGRGLVEIWASETTGSWTILVTTPKGQTCLMAAGEAFEIEAIARADTPI